MHGQRHHKVRDQLGVEKCWNLKSITIIFTQKSNSFQIAQHEETPLSLCENIKETFDKKGITSTAALVLVPI